MRRFKTQLNLVRAALMLLIALLTTGTAWAAEVQVTENMQRLVCGNTYLVSSNVSTPKMYIDAGVGGTVTLQLNEGCTLTVTSGGIDVSGFILVIQGTGSLVVNGGIYTLSGGGHVIINGGNITTTGSGALPGIGGRNAVIEINGGVVNATGGTLSAGIGSGSGTVTPNDFSSITITGGTVTAIGGCQSTGGGGSAGIGGSSDYGGGNIVISGGTITAIGGGNTGLGGGAGIGSGYQGSMGNITISGGNITATGGVCTSILCGAGIGSGYKGSIGDITITDGTVIANENGNNKRAAGIGDGASASSRGTIRISGGTITATGGDRAAGIGGSHFNNGGVIEISGGTVNATGNSLGAGIGGGYKGSGGTITISGGTVNATGSTGPWNGIGAAIGGGSEGSGGTITISGGTITTNGPIGIGDGREGNGGVTTLTYGNDITEPIITSNYNGTVTIAPGKAFKDSNGNIYRGTLSSEKIAAIANQLIRPVTAAEVIAYYLGNGNGTEENPYLISNADGWDYFCDCLQENDTWNHFSGKTVKLGADISITRSAGSSDHEFMGTFDGDYHTLTVNITDTTTQGTAPFREIRGATIRKLITTGSVNGTLHAAGLVGFARGDASVTNTIERCKVAANVTVTTAVNGNYHCGGVVGHALNSTLNISNTVYCGAISNSGNYVGGFQGWSDGNTVNLSNCLFTGSYEGGGVFHPMAVSYRNAATTATVNNAFYNATPTLTNAQYIAANGTKTVGVTDIPATLGSEVDTLNFMTVYEGGILFDGLYYASPVLSTDSDGAYVINNASEWEYFCEDLLDNDTWNRFSGKTVKLGADISVTRMAGSATHDFCGTFDGNHKTITFNYGSKAEPESGISALFSHTSSIKPFGADTISPATIKDLTVDGTIWTSSSDAAGFVGRIYGTLNLTGCTSNIAINSSADFPAGFINYSDQTSTVNISGCTSNATINTTASYAAGHVGHLYGSVNIEHSISNAEITAAGGAGGFVGLCEHTVNFSDCLSDAVIHSSSGNNSGFVGWSRASGHAISFTGCVFNGKLLQIDSIGNSNGGFIGWTGSNKTVTITDCLVDPAALAQGETMASGNSATFARGWNATTTATNCYFTDTLGVVQGKQAHSIIAGQGVTVEMANSATEYETSGITAYGTGIMYKGVLYAGVNDEVSLNLDGSDDGYSVNAGTLTGEGNPFILLMPDEDVTIKAATQFLRGDVNQDGNITIADVTTLIDYLLSNDSAIPAEADVNADDNVSIADVTALIDYLLNGAI